MGSYVRVRSSYLTKRMEKDVVIYHTIKTFEPLLRKKFDIVIDVSNFSVRERRTRARAEEAPLSPYVPVCFGRQTTKWSTRG